MASSTDFKLLFEKYQEDGVKQVSTQLLFSHHQKYDAPFCCTPKTI